MRKESVIGVKYMVLSQLIAMAKSFHKTLFKASMTPRRRPKCHVEQTTLIKRTKIRANSSDWAGTPSSKQARSQEFAMEGVVLGVETTSNDLDPDFGRSSLGLSRFFCPNSGDLKKGFLVEITSGP